MSAIRLITDEDIYGAIAPALRQVGIDAVSTPEMGRCGASDDEQLEWATTAERSIITFNVAHFSNLHSSWLANGRHHAGIIVSSQRTISELLRKLKALSRVVTSEEMCDRLEFLNQW